MTVETNFNLPRWANGTLQVTLAPPAPVSGQNIQFDLMYRLNSPQPIVSKYLASGYSNGQSGVTLIDGAVGVFQIALNPLEMSGLDDGNYAYLVARRDSGNVSPITAGWRLCNPF